MYKRGSDLSSLLGALTATGSGATLGALYGIKQKPWYKAKADLSTVLKDAAIGALLGYASHGLIGSALGYLSKPNYSINDIAELNKNFNLSDLIPFVSPYRTVKAYKSVLNLKNKELESGIQNRAEKSDNKRQVIKDIARINKTVDKLVDKGEIGIVQANALKKVILQNYIMQKLT